MHLLIPYLKHEQSECRIAVAEALGNQQSQRDAYLPMLEEALVNENDEEAHEAIVEAIAKLKTS